MRFTKNCPACGREQSYGRKDHYKSAIRGNWQCNPCTGRKNNYAGKYNSMPVTWFETKKKNGISRGYEWDLTIDFIWDMYVTQDKKCALSGLEIEWSERGRTSTVSIDRIDNSKGYLTNNIHLVHKDVNMMKGRLSLERFIELCKAISDRTNNETEETILG